jgi:hypothetical protein
VPVARTLIVAISATATAVLGPVVAHTELGGARSWGLILAAYAAVRFSAEWSCSGSARSGCCGRRCCQCQPFLCSFSPLAVPISVTWVVAAALLAGGCLEVYMINWATTMQQEIPPAMLSRLSSYDLLGSFALTPIGATAAGPAANAFGVPAVLTGRWLRRASATSLARFA